MIKNNFKSQLQAGGINKITATATNTNGNSAFSFGIVNSKSNGKRVSISKALAKAIGITETVDIIAQISAGVIHLGSDFSDIDGYSRYGLRGDDRKICYSYELVNFLTKSFGLNFTNHVSMSFRNISFTTHNDLPVATITLNESVAKNFASMLSATDETASSPECDDDDTPLEEPSVIPAESDEDDFVFDEFEEDVVENSDNTASEDDFEALLEVEGDTE